MQSKTRNTSGEMTFKQIADVCGTLAMLCATLQHVPQLLLNRSRRSVDGLSFQTVVFKHVGACFLFANSAVIHENMMVVLHGLGTVVMLTLLILQFAAYRGPKHSTSKRTHVAHPELPLDSAPRESSAAAALPEMIRDYSEYVVWLALPFAALLLALIFPGTVRLSSSQHTFCFTKYTITDVLPPNHTAYTNIIKPLTTLYSVIPQLIECWRTQSTAGVSKTSTALTFCVGLFGLVFCLGDKPHTRWTYVLYANDAFQALSLTTMMVWFDNGTLGAEARLFWLRFCTALHLNTQHTDL